MRIDDPIDNDAESDNIHMGNQRLCPKYGATNPITSLSILVIVLHGFLLWNNNGYRYDAVVVLFTMQNTLMVLRR